MPPDLTVKYQVRALGRAYLVEVHVPLAPAALSAAQATRLDEAIEAGRFGIATARDAIALELAMAGVCPWCGAARHEGECE